jgi:hypothetical protein
MRAVFAGVSTVFLLVPSVPDELTQAARLGMCDRPAAVDDGSHRHRIGPHRQRTIVRLGTPGTNSVGPEFHHEAVRAETEPKRRALSAKRPRRNQLMAGGHRGRARVPRNSERSQDRPARIGACAQITCRRRHPACDAARPAGAQSCADTMKPRLSETSEPKRLRAFCQLAV